MGGIATGPLTPPAYVAGSVTITGGATAVTIASLVQGSLDPGCPGSVTQFQLYSDANNNAANTIKVGCPVRGASSGTPGQQPLDDTHFGYELRPGASRTYNPLLTASTTIGNVYVFCTSTVTLHVEVFP